MFAQVISCFFTFYLIAVLMTVGCDISDPGDNSTHPEGWTEKTHGDESEPNYDVVFTQDVVKRLDITIKPADWQAMLWHMTWMLGRFGAGAKEVSIPPEIIEACEGKRTGDACISTIGNLERNGICLSQGGDQLFCASGGDGLQTSGTPIYRPCTLVFEGKTWWHVGVRFRGNSSLQRAWQAGIMKLPFNLDFDEFEDKYPEIKNQRFFGFKKLCMRNNFYDNSLLRDKVAGDIYRGAGVPAPRTAFYRLFIDHGEGPVYFGLYTMIELPRKPMLETQFGDTGGNLYKPEGGGATWLTFKEESFEKKTNESEADWSDVQAAIAALHAGREDPAVWRGVLEEKLDVNGFLRWLAVNTVIQNWDTYGNLPHNYYLYGDPSEGGRLCWFPWDNSETFKSWGILAAPLSLELTEVGDNWPLIRFLMDDSVYRAAYVSFVKETIEGAFSLESAQERIKREHALIEPYVVGPEGEQEGYSFLNDPQDFYRELGMQPQYFYTELDMLLDHVAQRNQDVFEFLATNQ